MVLNQTYFLIQYKLGLPVPCTCPTLSFSLSLSFPLCLCLCPGCFCQLLSFFFLSFCRSAPLPSTACMPSLSLSLFLQLKICALLDIYIGDVSTTIGESRLLQKSFSYVWRVEIITQKLQLVNCFSNSKFPSWFAIHISTISRESNYFIKLTIDQFVFNSKSHYHFTATSIGDSSLLLYFNNIW